MHTHAWNLQAGWKSREGSTMDALTLPAAYGELAVITLWSKVCVYGHVHCSQLIATL